MREKKARPFYAKLFRFEQTSQLAVPVMEDLDFRKTRARLYYPNEIWAEFSKFSHKDVVIPWTFFINKKNFLT